MSDLVESERAELERLRRALDRSIDGVTCAFCMEWRGPLHLIAFHALRCEKHPFAAMADELRTLRRRVSRLEARLARVLGLVQDAGMSLRRPKDKVWKERAVPSRGRVWSGRRAEGGRR